MVLSRNAESILDALTRDQGLRTPLRPDQDGVIAMEIGPELKVGLSFSPANDAFYLMGALGPATDDRLDALWRVFAETHELAERRTRIGLEAGSGQAVLVRDIFLKDLRYSDFAAALETFATDLEDAMKGFGRQGAAVVNGETDLAVGDLMIFRP